MQSVREAKAAVVRERVLDAVSAIVADGDDVTFAKAAAGAGVPERTVYRYFRNREELIAGLLEHTNRRIGFAGDRPTSATEMISMVRRAFPGFDSVAPVVTELLASPEGRRARLADVTDRRRAAIDIVVGARPDLDADTARGVAAIVQVLGTAAVWQALRDFWAMDGDDAAAAVTTVLEILLTNPHTPTTGGT